MYLSVFCSLAPLFQVELSGAWLFELKMTIGWDNTCLPRAKM
jgi:hypothetical protein